MKTKGLLILALAAMSFGANAQAWRQQYTNMTGASTYVDQISVVDSNIVWVNGANGTGSGVQIKASARTNDGGETWVSGIYNGFGSTVVAKVLAAVSYDNAFCIAMDTVESVAAPASFWKTTDGGANWSLVTGVMNASNTFADGVYFWNSNKGFCYGDPKTTLGSFDVYYTTDGGATWTPTTTPNAVSGEYGYNGPECATKAGNGVGGFMTNKGRVFVTNDYGVTWTKTAVDPFTTNASNKIYMANANFIIVASLATSTSTAYDWKYTTDGGATWNTYAAASGTFYTFQMAYVPGTTNMFVATSPYSTGDKGVGYATDGLNWADFYDATFLQDYSAANMQMLGVAFADSSNGWVGNYDYFSGENSILRYQRTNSTRFSVVASALQVSSVDAGTVSGVGNYNNGASVTLTATPLAGYVFEKWISYPDQTDLGTNATYTFTMPASNVAVLASFIVDPSAGVAQNDFGKLTVSPNPAANNVTIALNSKQNGVFNVNIVDLTGKSVYTNSLEANATMNVDVTAFAKGVYFVKINNDKTQFVQKLIVK
jgi:hypothetical protein